MGKQQVKNFVRPVRVYRLHPEGPLTHPDPAEQVRGLKAHDAPRPPLSRNAGEGAERRRREAGEGTAPPLCDKPSIAVLPCVNMSGDPLSRIRRLFLIARKAAGEAA